MGFGGYENSRVQGLYGFRVVVAMCLGFRAFGFFGRPYASEAVGEVVERRGSERSGTSDCLDGWRQSRIADYFIQLKPIPIGSTVVPFCGLSLGSFPTPFF